MESCFAALILKQVQDDVTLIHRLPERAAIQGPYGMESCSAAWLLKQVQDDAKREDSSSFIVALNAQRFRVHRAWNLALPYEARHT